MTSPVLRLARLTARVLPAPAHRAMYRLDPVPTLTGRLLDRAAPSGPVGVKGAAGRAEASFAEIEAETTDLDTFTQAGHSLRESRCVRPLIRRVNDLSRKAYVLGLPPARSGLP